MFMVTPPENATLTNIDIDIEVDRSEHSSYQ